MSPLSVNGCLGNDVILGCKIMRARRVLRWKSNSNHYWQTLSDNWDTLHDSCETGFLKDNNIALLCRNLLLVN